MKTLAQVIGSSEVDNHIIPLLIQMSSDKIWRVKLAVINFIPLLADFIDKEIFLNRLEGVVMSWL